MAEDKREVFDYDQYILEINENFVHWAGSRTVAIPFDIDENQLQTILSQINGVLFTGGGLKLVDPETRERTIIGGRYEDPTNGIIDVGTGPVLSYPFEVQKGPDGMYYVASYG